MAIFVFTIISVPYNILGYVKNKPDQFNFVQCIPFIIAFITFLFLVRITAYKKISYNSFVWISYILANIIMLSQLISFDTQPVADYKEIWNTACAMANGEFDINKVSHCDYIYYYNWQLGISAIESIFIRIFGQAVLPLKIFNLILINITLYLTHKLANIIGGRNIAKYTLFLAASFYPMLVTVSQFSNQHLVTPLFLFAIICIIKHRWLICGSLIAIINMIRPVGIILLIASIVILVYAIVKNRGKSMKMQFVGIIAFFVAFFATQTLINYYFVELNYADSPISKAKIPYYKFDKGLTGYMSPTEDIKSFDGDIDAFNGWERKKVVEAISLHPIKTTIFVAKKMCRYLGCIDWKVEMTYNHSKHFSLIVKILVGFGYGQYFFIIILALLGYIYWYKDKELSIIQIFYIGITLVYLFIEANSSYRYESYPILMIFAGMGVESIILSISSKNKTLNSSIS